MGAPRGNRNAAGSHGKGAGRTRGKGKLHRLRFTPTGGVGTFVGYVKNPKKMPKQFKGMRFTKA